MTWYFHTLQNYAIFHTRSRRREFFTFFGFHLLFLLMAVLLDIIFLGSNNIGKLTSLSTMYILVTFIPALAVTVRRLHDIGKTGMWLSMAFIPVFGWIYLLILLVQKSQKSVNEWGICPRRIRNA